MQNSPLDPQLGQEGLKQIGQSLQSIIAKLGTHPIFLFGIAAMLLAIVGFLSSAFLPDDTSGLKWWFPYALLAFGIAAIIIATYQTTKSEDSITDFATVHHSKQFKPLKKIVFEYSDSPVLHGWKLGDIENDQDVSIEHAKDGFIGKVVEIKSATGYKMEFDVPPGAIFGNFVEFAVKLEHNARLFTSIRVKSNNSTETKTAWLKYKAGIGAPYPVGRGNYEWCHPIKPINLGGEWLLFQIDLEQAVKETFGKKGWEFGELSRLRVRGNLSLAYISIFEREKEGKGPIS